MTVSVGHSSELCQKLGRSVSRANSYMALGQGCKLKVLSVEATQARKVVYRADCSALLSRIE